MSDLDPNRQGERPSWVVRHRSLSVLGGAAGLLVAGASVLWLHLAISGDSTAAGSPHEAAGDFVLFGLMSALVVGAAIAILHRIRAEQGARLD